MHRNVEKRRKIKRNNADKFREMQINAEKCREMQRTEEK